MTQSVRLPGPLATVTVITSPGFTVAGDTVSVGTGAASSFAIVPTPCAVPMIAFVALLKLTTKVSSGSNVVSPFTVTLTGCVLTPGANVNVPLVAT